jgi:nitroreductase
MNVMDAIEARWSVRSYAPRQVEPEKVAAIMEAGRLAPTASNEQKWKLIAVTDPELIAQMVPACKDVKWVGTAPLILVACADGDRTMVCGQSARTVDCTIGMSYMTLEAIEQGLGFCWLGWFYPEKVRAVLNIPDNYMVVAVATVGYPARDGHRSGKKSAEDVIVYNRMS